MPLRREKRENKVPVNFGLCLSIVDISEGTLQKPEAASQGLTLCWEWISTRAFDFRHIRLHSYRCSCQNPGLRVGVFYRGGKPSLQPCSPTRQCMLPEDQHRTPGLVPSILYPPHPPEPQGLAWGSPPALLPRHTLMPGSYSKLLVFFVEGPW